MQGLGLNDHQPYEVTTNRNAIVDPRHNANHYRHPPTERSIELLDYVAPFPRLYDLLLFPRLNRSLASFLFVTVSLYR